MQVIEFDLSDSSLTELKDGIRSTILSTVEEEVQIPELPPLPDLYDVPEVIYKQITAALRSGKRHIIFYGPPGTGKTTLAQYVAQELSNSGEFEMLTASSSWTSQELIGGYQPLGAGRIGFVPGAILRNFDRPIVIDELNRCPIDKVIGPLFSVLSGQTSTLPYKTNLEVADSPFHTIFPTSKENPESHEWFPSRDWRLITTLNTVDKSQLGQLSYALSRRFAWIKIGVPEDLNKFVLRVLEREDEPALPNPVADLWSAVNNVRQIGGAPIIDLIKTAKELDDGIDLLTIPNEELQEILITVTSMYILPLLDGIRRKEAEILIELIAGSWRLNANRKDLFLKEMEDIVA